MIDKSAIHKDICEKLNETYKAKNADYGDSFAKVRKEFPNAVLIRIADKFERLKQLMGGAEQQVKDESVVDTLLDLANYCIMEVVEKEVDSVQNRKVQEEQIPVLHATPGANSEQELSDRLNLHYCSLCGERIVPGVLHGYNVETQKYICNRCMNNTVVKSLIK